MKQRLWQHVVVHVVAARDHAEKQGRAVVCAACAVQCKGVARTGNDESVAWRVYTAPAEDPALPRVQVLQSDGGARVKIYLNGILVEEQDL